MIGGRLFMAVVINHALEHGVAAPGAADADCGRPRFLLSGDIQNVNSPAFGDHFRTGTYVTVIGCTGRSTQHGQAHERVLERHHV